MFSGVTPFLATNAVLAVAVVYDALNSDTSLKIKGVGGTYKAESSKEKNSLAMEKLCYCV